MSSEQGLWLFAPFLAYMGGRENGIAKGWRDALKWALEETRSKRGDSAP